MADEIDLRAAVNAISDVIQNRPRPLREFDQIYMKAGDMVMQSQFVAHWARAKRLAFIGDGDAISVCVAYLRARDIIPYGPSRVTVFDFDERIVNAVKRFADRERVDTLDARLYNCLDGFRTCRSTICSIRTRHGALVTRDTASTYSPPAGWKRSGTTARDASSSLTTRNSPGRARFSPTSKRMLPRTFYVSRMMPRLHTYHLDDAPDLRSCNLLIASRPGTAPRAPSGPVSDPALLQHFYGQDQQPRVRYVRERARVDYGKAPDQEYEFELLPDREAS